MFRRIYMRYLKPKVMHYQQNLRTIRTDYKLGHKACFKLPSYNRQYRECMKCLTKLHELDPTGAYHERMY